MNITDEAIKAHATAIDAIRKSRDELLSSELSPHQQQLVIDLINAAQDLNTAYWEQASTPHVHADRGAASKVLTEHQVMAGSRAMTPRCTCGWLGQVFGNDFHGDFITHQADMLTVPRYAPAPCPRAQENKEAL